MQRGGDAPGHGVGVWIQTKCHGAVHGPLRNVSRQLVTETAVQAKRSDFKPQAQHLALLSCLLGMLNYVKWVISVRNKAAHAHRCSIDAAH